LQEATWLHIRLNSGARSVHVLEFHKSCSVLPQAPVLVFEDADISSAVNGVAFAAFIASGQTCVSATRLLIHERIYDEFMEKFIDKVEKITKGMGDRT
jgi:hypothetical protein